jgi:non-homologous end joining protein Ku
MDRQPIRPSQRYSQHIHHDEYRERVMQFIEAKAKGRRPKLQAIRQKRPPSSLIEALSASLKQANRAGGKAVA